MQQVLVKISSVFVLLRIIIVPGIIALFVFFTIEAANIPLPETSEVQLFPNGHVFANYNKWINEVYFKGGSDSTSWATVLWGLEAADTGDYNNPDSYTGLVADPNFNPRTPEAQMWLFNFCNQTASQVFATGQYGCPMVDLNNWLSYNPRMECGGVNQLPIPEDKFDDCIVVFKQSSHQDSKLGVYMNRIAYIAFEFETDIRWNSPYNELKDKWNEWESYMQLENSDAPAGVNRGYVTSGEFHWWDTNHQMKISAFISAYIAIGIATFVLLISNRDIILTLFSVLSIFGILVSVAGTVVAMGWELGFLESICFSILVGLSCDFIIHFAHSYSIAEGSRVDKAMASVVTMGPPIFFAGITTALSGVCLFFCTILFYAKFGAILLLTMAYSLLGTFLFLVPLLALLGTTKSTVSMIKSACVDG